jgi:hypothetical protein
MALVWINMSDPWDIPPYPKAGDRFVAQTYQAVGLALSMWEMLEMALATLRAVLGAGPGDPIVLNYGSEVGASFAERADALERAAEAFFCRKPNQGREGDFQSLINRCRRFSQRRNDIAHGIASNVVGTPTELNGYVLYPTFAAAKRFDDGNPQYLYSSHEIIAFASSFVDLREEVFRFCDRLEGRTNHAACGNRQSEESLR